MDTDGSHKGGESPIWRNFSGGTFLEAPLNKASPNATLTHSTLHTGALIIRIELGGLSSILQVHKEPPPKTYSTH